MRITGRYIDRHPRKRMFKSDIDVLLGRDVFRRRRGRTDKLCFFSCSSTVEGTKYPERLARHQDPFELLRGDIPPGHAGERSDAYS